MIAMMMDISTVLVADDNPDDLELLRRAFGKAGFGSQFHGVADGRDVARYLKGEGPYSDRSKFPFPRLVLLDFKMRQMDGWEILQWIRQRPEFRRLPVIVFSGSDYAADVNKAYDLGANSYLIKPPTLEELLAAVKQIGEFWLQVSKLPEHPRLTKPLPEM